MQGEEGILLDWGEPKGNSSEYSNWEVSTQIEQAK